MNAITATDRELEQYEQHIEDLEQRLAAAEAKNLELLCALIADGDEQIRQSRQLDELRGVAFSLQRLAEAADRIAVVTDGLTIHARAANLLSARSWWRRLFGRGVR